MPLESALKLISEWVASCYSDTPFPSFESPVLSPREGRLLTYVAATAATSSSTQDSFDTLYSEDSFLSEVAGGVLGDAADLLEGWGPDEEDLRI